MWACGAGDLVTAELGEAERLDVFSALCFTNSLQGLYAYWRGLRRRRTTSHGRGSSPLEPHHYLRGLDPGKFTGPNGLHPWVSTEQMKSSQIHYHFLIDHGDWVRSPKAGERQMPNSSSKKAKNNDLGNYRPLKLTLVTGEIMDWVLLEHISGHMEEQMVTGNSKCGFMKTKTCLTRLASEIKLLDLQVRGELEMTPTLTLARVLTLYPRVFLYSN